MDELVRIGEQIERKIGRPLEVISGGGTTAIPLILGDTMAEKVNFLRVGEAILLAQDLKDEWGHILKECSQDTFNLQMEIIEIKDKATYPIGEIACDGFGQKNQYEDKGIRKRALLAGGKVDYGFPDMLIPKLKGVSIVGASSDHTIVDIEDVEVDLKIGDILDFQLTYATLVYGTSSADVDFKVV